MGFIDELLIILTTGLLAGILCRRWSLTPLMGYLAVGVLIGPHCLGWVGEEEKEIEHLAELGVFFLLFSIGLEMSMDELKRMSRYLVIAGPRAVAVVADLRAVVVFVDATRLVDPSSDSCRICTGVQLHRLGVQVAQRAWQDQH